MEISKLQKQLSILEQRMKRVKCNKCAEKIYKQALAIKNKINALQKMDKNRPV